MSGQSFPIEIDISQLPAGLFFVRVENNLNDKIYLQKIIKQ